MTSFIAHAWPGWVLGGLWALWCALTLRAVWKLAQSDLGAIDHPLVRFVAVFQDHSRPG